MGWCVENGKLGPGKGLVSFPYSLFATPCFPCCQRVGGASACGASRSWRGAWRRRPEAGGSSRPKSERERRLQILKPRLAGRQRRHELGAGALFRERARKKHRAGHLFGTQPGEVLRQLTPEGNVFGGEMPVPIAIAVPVRR